MVVHQTKNATELILQPIGRLDSTTSDEFLAVVEKEFTADTAHLKLDFSEVDYISSKGLRAMVYIYKNLRGRTMEIQNTNPSVAEIFHLSGLGKVLHME